MVLNITVPAGMVDINVHPRKSEVKFSDDKIIFKAVYHGILNALNNPLHERYERESSSYMNGTINNGADFRNNETNSNDVNTNRNATVTNSSSYGVYLIMAIVLMIRIERVLLYKMRCSLLSI